MPSIRNRLHPPKSKAQKLAQDPLRFFQQASARVPKWIRSSPKPTKRKGTQSFSIIEASAQSSLKKYHSIERTLSPIQKKNRLKHVMDMLRSAHLNEQTTTSSPLADILEKVGRQFQAINTPEANFLAAEALARSHAISQKPVLPKDQQFIEKMIEHRYLWASQKGRPKEGMKALVVAELIGIPLKDLIAQAFWPGASSISEAPPLLTQPPKVFDKIESFIQEKRATPKGMPSKISPAAQSAHTLNKTGPRNISIATSDSPLISPYTDELTISPQGLYTRHKKDLNITNKKEFKKQLKQALKKGEISASELLTSFNPEQPDNVLDNLINRLIQTLPPKLPSSIQKRIALISLHKVLRNTYLLSEKEAHIMIGKLLTQQIACALSQAKPSLTEDTVPSNFITLNPTPEVITFVEQSMIDWMIRKAEPSTPDRIRQKIEHNCEQLQAGKFGQSITLHFPIFEQLAFMTDAEKRFLTVLKDDESKVLQQHAHKIQDTIANYEKRETQSLEDFTRHLLELNPRYIDIKQLIGTVTQEAHTSIQQQIFASAIKTLALNILNSGGLESLAFQVTTSSFQADMSTQFLSILELIKTLENSPIYSPYFTRIVENKTTLFSDEISRNIDLNTLAHTSIEQTREELDQLLQPWGAVKSKNGISLQQKMGLSLLSKALTSKNTDYQSNQLNKPEIQFLNSFLEIAIKNKKLNGLLRGPFKKNKVAVFKSNPSSITFLEKFTYQTRDLELFKKSIFKAAVAWDAVKNQNPLTQESKLTRREFGAIARFAKLHTPFKQLKERGLLISPQLQEIALLVEKAYRLNQSFEAEFQRRAELRPKDILADDLKQYADFAHRKLTPNEKIMRIFVSRYGHVAKFAGSKVVTRNDEASLQQIISHVTSEHSVDDLSFNDSLNIDIFRLQLSRLISPDKKELLQQIFADNGLDWRIEIDKIYNNIEAELHLEGAEILGETITDNPEERRMQAGLAILDLKRGHTRKIPRNFRRVRDRMFFREGLEPKNKMICSEFVARATIASLVELEDRLKEIIQTHYQNKGIQSPDDIMNMTLIDIPIDSRERLKRIHPERLIRLLEKKGCIDMMPPNSLRQEILKEQ